MPSYLSPGVYVEEVPSAIKAIAGVSTSTAAFIGIVPDVVNLVARNRDFDPAVATVAAIQAGRVHRADASEESDAVHQLVGVHARVRRSGGR